MTTVLFRSAQASDWPRVVALLTEAGLPLAGAEAHLSDFLLAERAGALVGCAALEHYERDGLLRSVAVQFGDRGTGLGQTLVRRMLERAAADGLVCVTLLTTTAAGYFPRFGFHALPREDVPMSIQHSVEFREACPASAVAMMVELDQIAPGVSMESV